mmetsp:Transcript_39559/g.93145  ORF Transcript_39559/g.93145 Transcript_39559/m.93145 type:complete len:214 (+) Transcript_39559:186-827(+)
MIYGHLAREVSSQASGRIILQLCSLQFAKEGLFFKLLQALARLAIEVTCHDDAGVAQTTTYQVGVVNALLGGTIPGKMHGDNLNILVSKADGQDRRQLGGTTGGIRASKSMSFCCQWLREASFLYQDGNTRTAALPARIDVILLKEPFCRCIPLRLEEGLFALLQQHDLVVVGQYGLTRESVPHVCLALLLQAGCGSMVLPIVFCVLSRQDIP